jgi:hypothetical protein
MNGPVHEAAPLPREPYLGPGAADWLALAPPEDGLYPATQALHLTATHGAAWRAGPAWGAASQWGAGPAVCAASRCPCLSPPRLLARMVGFIACDDSTAFDNFLAVCLLLLPLPPRRLAAGACRQRYVLALGPFRAAGLG